MINAFGLGEAVTAEAIACHQHPEHIHHRTETRAVLLKVGCIRPLPLQTAYLPLFAQEILCHQHVVVVATVLLESILL
jgi:hypothetical protein